MPLMLITAVYDGPAVDTAALKSFWISNGLRFSSADDALTIGGWKLDRQTRSIYASMTYDDMVLRTVRVMTYGTEYGDASVVLRPGPVSFGVGDLALTADGLDAFRQAFGFDETRMVGLSKLTGHPDVRFTLNESIALTTQVPEPASWLLLTLGFAGLGLAWRTVPCRGA